MCELRKESCRGDLSHDKKTEGSMGMSFLNISKNLSSPRDRKRERESKGSGEGSMTTNHRIAISLKYKFLTSVSPTIKLWGKTQKYERE